MHRAAFVPPRSAVAARLNDTKASVGQGRAAAVAKALAAGRATARFCGQANAAREKRAAITRYKLHLWADKFSPEPEDDQFVGFLEEPPNPWVRELDAGTQVSAETRTGKGVGGIVASDARAAARHRGLPDDTRGEWLARLRRSEQKEVADELHRQASEKRAIGDNEGARELYCWVRRPRRHLFRSHMSQLMDAVHVWIQALAIKETAYGGDADESLASTVKGLASMQAELGEREDAVELYAQALAIEERTHGKQSEVVNRTVCLMAGTYVALGLHDAALSLYQEARTACEDAFGIDHSVVATAIIGIASIHRLRGNHAAALELFERAVAIQGRNHGPSSPELAIALRGKGGALRSLGRNGEALAVLEQARAILLDEYGPDHIDVLRTADDVAVVLSNLAAVHRACGHYQEALECLQEAVPLRERLLGSESPTLATMLSNLASLYAAVGTQKTPFCAILYQKRCVCQDGLGPYIGNIHVLKKRRVSWRQGSTPSRSSCTSGWSSLRRRRLALSRGRSRRPLMRWSR
jgi:tetratricopeptide (TPR) repeat protein